MDTLDRPDPKLPARISSSSTWLPNPAPVFSQEMALASGTGAPASAISIQMLLRGLIRHWWHILALWIVLSVPLLYLIYLKVEPKYEAVATIRVEPPKADLFSTSSPLAGREFNLLLQTHIDQITSVKVLDRAIGDPRVKNLPLITQSDDPRSEVLSLLDVKQRPGTYIIQVSFQAEDRKTAESIVQSVVDAYVQESGNYGQAADKALATSMRTFLDKLNADIAEKQQELITLHEKGTIKSGPVTASSKSSSDENSDHSENQPTARGVSEEKYQTLYDRWLDIEMELSAKNALLRLRQSELENTQAEQQASDHDIDNKLIEEEFFRDPEVLALSQKITEAEDQLSHISSLARQLNEPSKIVLRQQLDRLKDSYEQLWQVKQREIRSRLMTESGVTGSPESIQELKSQVELLTAQKKSIEETLTRVKVEAKESNGDVVRASIAQNELERLRSRWDLVDRKLKALEFQVHNDLARVEPIDKALAPQKPSINKRLKYMAVAPFGILFAMLGLFMLLEVKAERVADPDMLSSRVHSEVYALPPLPSAREVRKLKSPEQGTDTIDRFIQRLDHLRFAVCDVSSELGKGRCVLITSAVGGEGKTTLAAQLAARCGNSGMSTLLIDADMRKGALGPLLAVSDGPGLSDVLNGVASVEDVVVPVQGGAFHLLLAGTPNDDISRVLKSRSFGLLMSRLREIYDLIVIDSPPVLPVPDALVLGQWADGAILASRYDVSRFPQVERARKQLDGAGITVLGTVINGMRSTDSYYGRYSYSRGRTSPSDPSTTI